MFLSETSHGYTGNTVYLYRKHLIVFRAIKVYFYKMMKRTKTIFGAIAFFCAAIILIFSGCSKPGDTAVRSAMKAFSAKSYDKALEFLNQALEEESNYSPELLFTFIANVYSALDDTEMSTFYLEKALERKPDYRGFVTLGMNYQSMGNFEKAFENYNNAVALNPDKGEAYASLGIVFMETNQSENAVLYLEKASALEPKIAVIHAELATAYAMNGQNEKSDEQIAIAESLKCANIELFKEKIAKMKNSE